MRDLGADEAGLSLRHLQVLGMLAERQRSHGEIVETLAVSPSIASRVCKSLVDLGYASRTADPDDLRVVQFAATRAGRALLERVRSIGKVAA